MLSKDDIMQRREALMVDLNTVQGKLTELEKQRLETVALQNALTGAVQQCDDFLQKINNVEPESSVSSDEG
jgi:ribosomal 50S subunit-associated protein YjgA (DUF615 family)|tara:strand:- start:312 stop:524 length:213 start_codon:yes stop_codon:yes gene_type:complete